MTAAPRAVKATPFPGVGEQAAAADPTNPAQRAVAFVRRHPTAADAVLGLVMFALSLPVMLDPDPSVFPGVRDGDAVGVVLLAASTLSLTWRRTYPIAVLAVATCGVLPFLVLNYADAVGTLGGLIAVYSVGAHVERRTALLVTGVAFAPFAATMVAGVISDGENLPVSFGVANALTFWGAFAIGDAFRTRRAYVAELQLRIETADRLRAEEASSAMAAERTRIARELHDVVAHGMSVMVLQASGASRVLERHPDQAATALAQIEATGRESLAEMRQLLGVLRSEPGPADPTTAAVDDPLRPQPGLADLPELVDRWTASGMPVHLEATATDGDPLPAGVDLAVYRIVQEALTNVARHAGVVDRVEVTASRTDDGLIRVTVTDDGRGAAAPGNDTGHGLLGMRERAAVYDGDVTVGPRPGGGWSVEAVLRCTSPIVSAPAPADAHEAAR